MSLANPSLPHGGVDRNFQRWPQLATHCRRSLTGAWIETTVPAGDGVASGGRSLTGAWIETIS